MITNYASKKIKIISFVAIVLVLYIHSSFAAANSWITNRIVQYFIGDFLGRLAVPLFFILSGFLFFLNTDSNFTTMANKIKKRIHTLFIPYLIGCLFFVVFSLLIQVLPFSRPYSNTDILSMFDLSIIQILKKIFLWTNDGTPLAFHLWFLRNLILIVFSSPILWMLFKYVKWGVPILFFIASVTFQNSLVSGTFNSFYWFSLGATFSLYKLDIKISKPGKYLTIFLYLVLSVLAILLSYQNKLFNIVLVTVGVAGFWFLYDLVFKNIDGSSFESAVIARLSPYTFFIYIYHEPTINVFRKGMLVLFGKSSPSFLFSYLLTPAIFILIVYYSIRWIKEFRLYRILVGGRT